MTSLRWRTLAALAAVAVALAGCGKESKEAAPAAAAAPAQAVAVTVRKVEPQRVPIVLDAVGQAEGSREVEIRARVAGILERRLYNEGGAVKAGDTLFTIERAPFELAVAQAKAALAQEVAKQEEAQREAERLQPLAESKAISRREYDQAASAVKTAAAAIEGAKAKLAEAELNLSYTNVKAPIAGITGRALRSEGSLVAGSQDLLTTISQVNPIWVRFSLAEQDFERIRANAGAGEVRIVQDDGTVLARNGKLNFTGSTIDPKLGTVQLRAEFPNPGERFLPGRYLKVQVAAGVQEAFLVPQAAVVQSEQARSVWIVDAGNKAQSRVVKTANWLGADWIVTSGLAAGDLVITDNLMRLRPGTDVQPTQAAAPAVAAAPAPAAAAPR
ncbi:MAG: efflux RND transporter periplasmic adaptor subunit [Burkholderiales bacterium]